MAISSSLSVMALLLVSFTLISAQAPGAAPIPAPKPAPVPSPTKSAPVPAPGATAPVASPPAPPAVTPAATPSMSPSTTAGSPESGTSFSSPPNAAAPTESAAARSVISSIGLAGALLIVATAF